MSFHYPTWQNKAILQFYNTIRTSKTHLSAMNERARRIQGDGRNRGRVRIRVVLILRIFGMSMGDPPKTFQMVKKHRV